MSKFKKSCLWGAASATTLLCALTTIGTANASGFQVRETSGTLQGSSFAGMTTLSTDASTIAFNPGTVGQYDETTYSAGGSLIIPDAKAKNISASGRGLTANKTFTGNSYGDMAQDALVPNTHAVWKLRENINVGLSITAPWGLVTDYEPDFSGRYYGTTSKIKSVNIKPVVAYRFDNGLSIGAGPQIQRIEASLSRTVPQVGGTGEGNAEISGDAIDFGWTAGLNWEVVKGTSFGLSYNSEVKHNLDGKIDFDSAANALSYIDRNATAKVATPEAIAFGLSHELDDQWTVMADAQWTNWNSIGTLRFLYDGQTHNTIGASSASTIEHYNWGSSWFGALGARYQHDENWSFTAGFAFDETPIKTRNRNVRLPDSNRYWTSLGAAYQIEDWVSVSLGYTHIFADEARVDLADSNLGNFSADYEASVDIIALQANFKF